MSAAPLAASASAMPGLPTTSTTAGGIMPDALQQFLHKIEEQRRVNLHASADLYNLKADLESRWRTAICDGDTSSTMLYQILEYGWREWRRIIA